MHFECGVLRLMGIGTKRVKPDCKTNAVSSERWIHQHETSVGQRMIILFVLQGHMDSTQILTFHTWRQKN